MKRRMTFIAMVMGLLVLLGATAVVAQDDVPAYYVDPDYNPEGNLCEDGSLQCPFRSPDDAIDAGQREVCEGQPYYVYVKKGGEYPAIPRTYSGEKPVPGTGLPLARVAQILIIALVGLIVLFVALRLQHRSTAG